MTDLLDLSSLVKRIKAMESEAADIPGLEARVAELEKGSSHYVQFVNDLRGEYEEQKRELKTITEVHRLLSEDIKAHKKSINTIRRGREHRGAEDQVRDVDVDMESTDA